jgi:hypothetical protein
MVTRRLLQTFVRQESLYVCSNHHVLAYLFALLAYVDIASRRARFNSVYIYCSVCVFHHSGQKRLITRVESGLVDSLATETRCVALFIVLTMIGHHASH